MPVIEGLSWTFDTVTQEFDKWSPTYNKELYEDLFAYKKIDNQSKVLEIGIGTGKATVPVLQTGCHLTAVELGKNLSDFCRIKFNDYPNFSVENTAFENFSTALSSYDLIYSAKELFTGYQKNSDTAKFSIY